MRMADMSLDSFMFHFTMSVFGLIFLIALVYLSQGRIRVPTSIDLEDVGLIGMFVLALVFAIYKYVV